jgi:hypothetical protein
VAWLKLIHEYERYYGIAFMELFEESKKSLKIESLNKERTSFLINGELGVYLKHSSSRANFWNFAYGENDYREIRMLTLKSKEVAFVCVCGFHGVCILNSKDFATCAGFPDSLTSRVTVRTRLKGSWSVNGSFGELTSTRSKTKPWSSFKEYFDSNN